MRGPYASSEAREFLSDIPLQELFGNATVDVAMCRDIADAGSREGHGSTGAVIPLK